MINLLSYGLFSFLCVSCLSVVLLQNTFFALLFLITSFLISSILLFFFECEFLALILAIIYVGAVAVLLLFVLIMLETKLKNFSKDILTYFPFGVLINSFFFLELLNFISQSFSKDFYSHKVFFNSYLNWYNILDSVTDLEIYGQILYTQLVLQLLVVGLALFLSLVGVIFLTRQPMFKSFKSQTSFCQLSRNYLEQNPRQTTIVLKQKNSVSWALVSSTEPNQFLVSVEHIQIPELTFLPEYYFVTAIFCLTLFALFSFQPSNSKQPFSLKFQYNSQIVFLLILTLVCYLILIFQQIDVCKLATTSFNESIYNDHISLVSKLIIGIFSIFYLIFTTYHMKDQKLENFEYYILVLTSIFGFFLLCSANDLITAYLAIELQGLSFYVLASFKKSSNFSIESGVKYFVLGSLSTALFLLGVTFLYGLSGSVLLTDFKDFFIWVFSAGSFFLSFEHITEALNVFQEKSCTQGDAALLKMQIIYDKCGLLKKADSLNTNLHFLTTTFENFHFKPEYLDARVLDDLNSIILKLYNSTDLTQSTSSYGNNYLNEKTFLETYLVLINLYDFFIEIGFQNVSIEVPSHLLYEKQLQDYFLLDLKKNVFEINYYEDAQTFYGCPIENFKTDSSNSILKDMSHKIECDMMFMSPGSCFSNVFNLLECYAFSEYLTDIINLAEPLPTDAELLDLIMFFNTLLDKSLEDTLAIFQDSPAIMSLTNQPNDIIESEFDLKNLMDYQSYLLSVVSLENMNTYFYGNFDNFEALLAFDLSYAEYGVLLLVLALFFKLALAPFHLWAPDVYEGSPSSSTFFFMVISKLGIFIFLLRICYSSFYSFIDYWQFYSLLVATTSIFVGSVGGLKQRRLKSLLTYSSINNMGFVLLAFSAGSFEGIQAKFYYLIVYMLASVCIWSILLNMKLKRNLVSEKQNRDLGDLALLQESHSIIAQNLGITLFSLAGLPPMVGFLAKIGVLKSLNGVSLYYFSIINVLLSVIATFYYLRLTKIIFFENRLVGNLYTFIANSKQTFFINLLTILLIFLFICPVFLYLYSYRCTLLFFKAFY